MARRAGEVLQRLMSSLHCGGRLRRICRHLNTLRVSGGSRARCRFVVGEEPYLPWTGRRSRDARGRRSVQEGMQPVKFGGGRLRPEFRMCGCEMMTFIPRVLSGVRGAKTGGVSHLVLTRNGLQSRCGARPGRRRDTSLGGERRGTREGPFWIMGRRILDRRVLGTPEKKWMEGSRIVPCGAMWRGKGSEKIGG